MKGIYIVEYNYANKNIKNTHYMFFKNDIKEIADNVAEVICQGNYDTFRIGFLTEEQVKILLQE